ncbi:MAG: response regulator [Kiritimatiellae bacterium]|nr:response regulator [Kiritimatiellia bacterium]
MTIADYDRPMNILHADRHSGFRDFVKKFLGRNGHHVDAVSTGEEALQKVNVCRYDLCLIGLRFPGLCGFEAARAIRSHFKYFPIILITGYPSVNRKMCLAEGVDDFIPKPFKLNELKAKISKWTVKTLPIIKESNTIERTKEAPMNAKHLNKLKELTTEGFVKMNMLGVDAHNPGSVS